MRKQTNPLVLGLSIIALALSLYAVVQVSTTGGDADEGFKEKVYNIIDEYVAEKSGNAGPKAVSVEETVDDDAVKGDPNAPVTIVEFSDFECPYCGKYIKESYPQIIANYVETGKVKYMFRDFPLVQLHPHAAGAANAAECIRDQGGDDMFFDYHDVLFQNQKALDVDSLKQYAADFDIDQAEFASCVDNNKFADEINKDFSDGQALGVGGTPGFFINGKPLIGAQPYAAFEAAIEEALKN